VLRQFDSRPIQLSTLHHMFGHHHVASPRHPSNGFGTNCRSLRFFATDPEARVRFPALPKKK
jgi:hypothetical protein